MLDIHFIREHKEEVRANLEKRQLPEYTTRFDEMLEDDIAYRRALQQVESLRGKRNQLTQQVAASLKNPIKKEELVQDSKQVGEQIKQNEETQKALKKKIHDSLMRLPNLLEEDVPFGKDDTENVEIKKWGKIIERDFEPLSHADIALKMNGVEFERAVKIAGNGFYMLKGELLKMEMAIQRYALDILEKDGFIQVQPPFLMNRAAYEGVTDLAEFDSQLYKIEKEDLHLIATSEHPLTAQFMNEHIPINELPIQLAGISPCFRKEVGKHGIDERGLFRVHQFNKIEQVVICSPEDSKTWHERMLVNTEKMFQGLEIPYRIVNVCTGDIGIVAAKKYDIEGYSPREKKYFELGSLSNCTTYQSVRLNMRMTKEDGTKTYPHTLNATGIATSRMLRAILENHQTKDGSIRIPEVLRP
ncbi:MAG: serine--tRNA ligase [Candidatus Diapherotrites archaeon]